MENIIELKQPNGKTALAQRKVVEALYELWAKAVEDDAAWEILFNTANDMDCNDLLVELMLILDKK